MPPSGSGKRKIMFIAEAPGKEEDRQGKHLVGEPGQYLRDALDDLNVDLDDCWKTNAILCYPGENSTDAERAAYIDSCCPTVLKTIKKLKPNVIVLLGGSAIKSVISMEREEAGGGVSKWAGWTIPSHEHQAWLVPTFHPSFLLHKKEDPVLVMMFRDHLKRAIALEHTPVPSLSLKDLKDKIELITSPRLARKRVKDLAKKKGILAFDYEANRLKPDDPRCKIYSVSFCLNGEDTFACIVDDKLKRHLSKVLLSPKLKKVAANIKFEERWTRVKLGHPVTNWYWDTMLAAHVLNQRSGITSLKFYAYIYFGVASYNKHVESFLKSDDKGGFNKIHKLNVEDLLMYNGLDSLLEYMSMKRQREEMGL